MIRHVVLKGGRRGLRVILDPGPGVDELVGGVKDALSSRLPFLSGAEIVFETSGRPLTPDLMQGLVDAVASLEGLSLKGFLTEGLPPQAALVVDSAVDTELLPSQVYHVRGNVRSGKIAVSPGDIIVHGSVNPGAEIRAGGDIYVLGALQGSACAGTGGGSSAIIYAAVMEPGQLRIGDTVASGDGEPGSGPEVALVRGRAIEVLPWFRYLREREGDAGVRSAPDPDPGTTSSGTGNTRPEPCFMKERPDGR